MPPRGSNHGPTNHQEPVIITAHKAFNDNRCILLASDMPSPLNFFAR